MNSTTRIWALVCGAATVAVLAGGWFLGVQPQLDAAATAVQTTASVDAQNQATQVKIATLTRAAAKSDALEAQDAVLLKSVPSILKPNTFIRRINEVAALDGVQVQSVAPGEAVAYTAPTSDGSTGTPAPVLAKTDPAINAANFTSVPVTVAVAGSADAVLQFAHDIQNDERTFDITSYALAKGEDDTTFTGTLGGLIYVLKR